MKIYNIVLTLLFLCMLSVCFLNDLFQFYKVPEISKTENRKLAAKPLFNLTNLDPFPDLYEHYFNDQFPYRQELGFVNTLISYFYFHQSPLPGVVELGKNGWLFFDQKESIVYQGKFTMANGHVRALVAELHERSEMYRKRGIRFYVAFPPMKPEVYPEFLPGDFRRSPGGTLTDKIVSAIRKDTTIRYIDLKDAMLKAKKYGRLYEMYDNHWNWIGAYYGYTAISERIKRDFPAVKPVTRSDFYFKAELANSGNLASMIGLSNYLKETEYYPRFKQTKGKFLAISHKTPDWAAHIPNYEKVTSTGNGSLPNTVIIHDSYTDVMMPFLDETFDTTTYIFDGWRYRRNESVVDEVKPRIILLIIFEPHISNMVGK
jgi:alginate O-acetyltransferase complex protein AlgJ